VRSLADCLANKLSPLYCSLRIQIGVKLAKTWNLTTHRIDPAVDEARDYVLSSLLETGHLAQLGYVGGVGESTEDSPRQNLGGDPYFTDGKRVVLFLSASKTQSKLFEW